MLDGLEAADWATKLDSDLGIVNRHVETHLGATDLLGGEADRSKIEHTLEDVPAATIGTDKCCWCVVEGQTSLFTGLIHGRQVLACHASSVAVDCEDAYACGGASCNQNEVGDVTVEDVHLGAAECPAVTATAGLHCDAVGVPLAAFFAESEGGNSFTAGNTRQVSSHCGFVAAMDQRVGCKHDRREEWSAQQ